MEEFSKKAFRREIKKRKAALSESGRLERSRALLDRVGQMAVFRQAGTILAYWSLKDEVYTHEHINRWAREKTIVLPVVQGEDLALKKFTRQEGLVPGQRYGIGEPQGEPFLAYEQIGLVLVPGVGFDKKNNRLGRGKAYYDKLLPQLRAYKMGLAFDFQIFPEIPVDSHDVPLDHVLIG